MLYQYQCQEEGTLFYYQERNPWTPHHLVDFCPVCGTADVAPTGRVYPAVDERAPPVRDEPARTGPNEPEGTPEPD